VLLVKVGTVIENEKWKIKIFAPPKIPVHRKYHVTIFIFSADVSDYIPGVREKKSFTDNTKLFDPHEIRNLKKY
jgi:hypothetical protein